MSLQPAAPLPGTVIPAAPLPGTVVTAAPLPEMADTAAPLPETADTAAPLLEMADTAAPLLEMADTAVPLPETADTAAPLSEKRALTACSSPGATPPPGAGKLDHPSPMRSTDQKAVIAPARPENYWLAEEGASGPLPLETGDPAPLQADVVSSTELSLPGVCPVGPAPLAVPESFEVSPIESPWRSGGAGEAPIEDPCSPTQARMGRPSVTEVLQQRVIRKQITVTTVEKEETIEQHPPEAEVEPMVISGGNTPVAPDDAELDIAEEQESLMDETHL